MTNNLINLRGKSIKTIYKNQDNYFSVLVFQLDDLDESEIIITGFLPDLEKDISYKLEGYYIEHPKYGMQFKVEKFDKLMPDTKEAMIRYLSSPLFYGIGVKIATEIIDYIGDNALNIIKSNPAILNEIPKLNDKKKQAILEGFKAISDEVEELLQFFMLHGISTRNVMRLNKLYGSRALEVIQENPYKIYLECDGFGFKTAEKLASSLNIAKDDIRRLSALLLYICEVKTFSSGDTFSSLLEIKDLFEKEMVKTGIDINFYDILDKAILENILVVTNDTIYTKPQYLAQEFIGSFLSEFPCEEMYPYSSEDLETNIRLIQEDYNIVYKEKQIEAIKAFYDNNLMVLTGGPGTGKTTVVRAIVGIYKKMFPYSSICCCAPTGRAAKRLSELTETEAFTIHSLLKWDLETNTFAKNMDDPLLIDVLIIDEFSMVDNYLFYNLLKAGRNIKKICIIGDEDQLPSVGPGCLLKDIIESNLWPLVRLDHIFRQEEGSDVISLARDIKANQVEFIKYKSNVAFIETDNYHVVNGVLNVVSSALNKGYNLNDIQVLSCMYNGTNGINRLNLNLQKYFNPHKDDLKELTFAYTTFRVNDKVLQLKNQPDDNVYNGDIGTIVDIVYASENEFKQNRIYVDFDGIIVEYGPDQVNNISHAYCISIHKSQGSEYPIVILPLVKENMSMIEKRLIYTAITRAKKSLILIGSKDVFFKGISILEKHERKSILSRVLKEKKDFFTNPFIED